MMKPIGVVSTIMFLVPPLVLTACGPEADGLIQASGSANQEASLLQNHL